MINWFTSLKGTIVLSTIGMLTFIGYTFLESLYFLGDWITSKIVAAAMTLIVIGIVGGWVWGLLVAAGGNRSGLFMLLVFSLISALITLYDLVFYSPIPYGWPLLQIMVWTTFVSCTIAIVAIIIQIRQ